MSDETYVPELAENGHFVGCAFDLDGITYLRPPKCSCVEFAAALGERDAGGPK